MSNLYNINNIMIAEMILWSNTTDIRRSGCMNSVEQDVFSNQITYDSPWHLNALKLIMNYKRKYSFNDTNPNIPRNAVAPATRSGISSD
jgi:hypothetical protein